MAVESDVLQRKLVYWLLFVGVLAAIDYIGRFATNGNDSNVFYTWGAAVAGTLQAAVFIGLMLLIARGLPTRWAFALRRPTSWGLAAGLDLAALLAVLVVNGIVSQFTNPGKEQGLIPNKWEPAHEAAFIANAVVVIVFAPVSEELVFRGLGYRLLRPYGRWTAILLVGATFALVHGLVEAFPVLFAFGTALAYIRDRTGSVYPTMALHATFNALAILFFFL